MTNIRSDSEHYRTANGPSTDAVDNCGDLIHRWPRGRGEQGESVPFAFFRASGHMHDFAMFNALAVWDIARMATELADL